MTPRKPLLVALSLAVLAVGPALAQPKGGAKKGAKPAAASASASASAPASATASATATSAPTAVASGGPTPNTSALPGSVPTTPDGQTYAVRLRDLEQRVDELKEQIRRSHTRLSLLSETVLSTGIQGSRGEINFQNDMSSAFRLIRALFVLDGAVQYNKADETGALSEQASIPIFSGSIPPGDHTLQVLVELQGNGYGVFSYLKGYRFKVNSTHSFRAIEGKTINLQVIAYEKGGVTTPLEERPAIRYFEKLTTGITGGSGAPAPANSAPPISTNFSIGGGSP